jgi:hypothetical protein
MKTPFRGFLDLASLPEPLTDASPRSLFMRLTPAIEQDGTRYDYLVGMVKVNEEGKPEVLGKLVLCQTEGEANESRQLLEAYHKTSIGVAQWAGGGSVVTGRHFKAFCRETGVFRETLRDGKVRWWAGERDIDKATGELEWIRKKMTDSESEAKAIADSWLRESLKEVKSFRKAVADSKELPTPPANCYDWGKEDGEAQKLFRCDVADAKEKALTRRWPHCFAVLDRIKKNPELICGEQELRDAYALDLIEHGHNPSLEPKRQLDTRLIERLYKASRRAGKRKRRTTELALHWIALNWELGWCYHSDKEIAIKLSEILLTRISIAQAKHYRLRDLGLVARHKPGPPQKSA